MTKAEQALAALTAEHFISPTGHAPSGDVDAIFKRCGPGELLTLVESDACGYPLVSEKWEALRYDDGSLLICTNVRGRKGADFWKTLTQQEMLADFEIWDRYPTA